MAGSQKIFQNIVLKEDKPINARPGELSEPVDFNEIKNIYKINIKRIYRRGNNELCTISRCI